MWTFLYIDRLLTKSFTQSFKERYHHKGKESQVSNLKSCLSEEAPKEKSAKDGSLYESLDFSEIFIGVEKIPSFLERLSGKIFLTELGGTHFCGRCRFFLRPRKKCTTKKPRRNSVSENSSNVRRNVSPEERWKNYAERTRLTPKSAKLAWYAIVKTQW